MVYVRMESPTLLLKTADPETVGIPPTPTDILNRISVALHKSVTYGGVQNNYHAFAIHVFICI